MLKIHGEHLSPKETRICFQSEAVRDQFATAIKNIAAGRAFNESEEDARENARIAQEQADENNRRKIEEEAARLLAQQQQQKEDDMTAQDSEVSAPEPEVEFNVDRSPLTVRELRALQGGTGDQSHLGALLQIGSKVFRDFYENLKANPASYDEGTVIRETRAESFRLWALKYVTTMQFTYIKGIEKALMSKFLDTNSSTGPFSATAIYGMLGLSRKILDHERSTRPTSTAGRIVPKSSVLGPQEYLRVNDGVQDRKRKEAIQRTLQGICQRFEDSRLFGQDGELSAASY